MAIMSVMAEKDLLVDNLKGSISNPLRFVAFFSAFFLRSLSLPFFHSFFFFLFLSLAHTVFLSLTHFLVLIIFFMIDQITTLTEANAQKVKELEQIAEMERVSESARI
jgi:uncharacterized membrane protein